MSRSNPHVNAPNPAVRWFEWNGEKGQVRYYDKDAKANVDVPLPFTFLVLDELSSVRGWDDSSGSGIYSNEVKDTRTEVFVVKSFKGGILAEGLYKDIKDRVNARGGKYHADCYIAFKHTDGLAIGVLRFKGAALGAWMDFRKAHRASLDDMAVDIASVTEGTKGRIVYKMPAFTLKKVTGNTQEIAVSLDVTLQGWLKAYFSRPTEDRVPAVGPDDPGAEHEAPDVSDIGF